MEKFPERTEIHLYNNNQVMNNQTEGLILLDLQKKVVDTN